MLTMTDRLTRYLLARQRRKAIHDLYETAAGAGLIESDFIEPGVEESGLVWRLPEGSALTSDLDADRRFIARALLKKRHPAVDSAGDPSSAFENVHFELEGRIERGAGAAAADGRQRQSRISRVQCSKVLRLIREHLPPPAVAEAAVALLLARAVGESLNSLDDLLMVLKRPDAIVIVRAAAHAFENRFGKMLDAGLIIPTRFRQVDGFGQSALNGSYRDNSADRRIITLSGVSARDKSAELIRVALMKAWSQRAPMVIADELPTPLPPRIIAGADLVLTSAGIDRVLIAELMQLCAGIVPKVSIAALEEADVDGAVLGIDDLVLAVRPRRSAQQIADALKALEAENCKAATEEEDDEREKSGSDKRRTSAVKSKKAGASTFEIIQPVGRAETKTDEDTPAATDRVLLIENLAGYGEARDWALDLKADLALWREGKLDWSEMSTKLLLSGPPGTGKTTYAKALCNSLEVPMLATSVAQWLEPGYLGDVLKLMSSAFATARENKPAILFVDEIDGIGRRGNGGQFPEYWDSLVNRALELLDGVGKSDGVIVVGATNHPDRIDAALRRSGRLERHIVIPQPDAEALAGILAHHLGSDLERVLKSRAHASSGTQPQAMNPTADRMKPVTSSPVIPMKGGRS